MKNHLSLEQLCSIIPSIKNEGKISDRLSERYQALDMFPIVERIMDYGFKPVIYSLRTRQAGSSWDERTAPFFIHFVHGAYKVNKEGDKLSLILTSSHDGIKPFSLKAGVFVNVCSNGLYLTKEELFAFQTKHIGANAPIVVEQALDALGDAFGQAKSLVQKMQERKLAGHEKNAFAEKILAVRGLPIELNREAILLPEFKEQASDSLYDVMNVVQGNSVRAKSLTGEKRKARSLILPEQGIIRAKNIGNYEMLHNEILETALSFL